MGKLHINEDNLKNARTSETFPGTSPIFAISSNAVDSRKTSDSSNNDVPSSTTRRWTQVCGFFKITHHIYQGLNIQAYFTFDYDISFRISGYFIVAGVFASD